MLVFAVFFVVVSSTSVSLPSGIFYGSDQQGQSYAISFSAAINCSGVPSGDCQTMTNGVKISAGAFGSRVDTPGTDVYLVNYANGLLCVPVNVVRSTSIIITCDPNVPTLAIDSVLEPELCTYVVKARSTTVCSSNTPSCVYTVDGNTYDLTRTPLLSLSTPLYVYTVSLCSPLIPCNGRLSHSCQSMNAGGQQFSLGTFIDNATHTSFDSSFEYGGGDVCLSSGPRITQLEAVCGTETVLYNVTETQPCLYEMVLVTPLACPPGNGEKATLRKLVK